MDTAFISICYFCGEFSNKNQSVTHFINCEIKNNCVASPKARVIKSVPNLDQSAGAQGKNWN